MLASSPASMVNQKRSDLGIPNRVNLTSSRFSSFYGAPSRTMSGALTRSRTVILLHARKVYKRKPYQFAAFKIRVQTTATRNGGWYL
jgi:hypothetical protein